MKNIPNWVNSYVGIPFVDFGRDVAGTDCWGLVCLVYKNIYGISLPSYLSSYSSALDRPSVQSHIQDTTQEDDWDEILLGWEREGDLIITRHLGLPCHVALVVSKGWMLHAYPQRETVLESYERPAWNRAIHGIFRHKSLSVPAGVV